MKQHASLSPERWSAFGLEQQILMISNEMHRAGKLLAAAKWDSLGSCYERVLRLVDLTVAVQSKSTLRRELLRWRDLVAELCVAACPDSASHAAALRALLLLTPGSARQIPYVLPGTAR